MGKGQLLITYKDLLNLYMNEEIGNLYIRKYKKWFPILGSVELSGIIADLMSDGHLQGKPRWRFDYTYKNEDEKERFEKELISLFNIKGKSRPCTTNKFSKTYNYGVNCKALGRVMYLCGVPTGNKVLKKYSIPKWILDDREFFRRFIQRLFTCEGTVWEGKSPGIRIELWKEVSILKNLAKMLKSISFYLNKHFNIITTEVFTTKDHNMRKDGAITKPIRMHIKRKASIIKFHNEIGFEDKVKSKKLSRVVNKWGHWGGNRSFE